METTMELQGFLRRGVLLAGVSMGCVAHAQSSVTLYGVVDTGLEYVSHANAAGQPVVRIPPATGEFPSRWGFRGTEDLGGGVSVVFNLESSFYTSNGALGLGGRLFGRQSWVGIQSKYGLLSFGRQYTMGMWATLDSDILNTSIYGLSALDTYLAFRRSDNTVAYQGKLAGFTFGASYAFGRDSTGTGNSPGQGTCAGATAGNFMQCREWNAMLKYDGPWFGVATAYDEQRGGPSAAANFFDGVAPFPLTSSQDKDARTYLGGYLNVDGVKVGAGYIGRMVTTVTGPDVRSNIFYIGASWWATPTFTVDGQGMRVLNHVQDARASMISLRGTYLLSKSSAVYLQSGYLANSPNAQYSVSGGGGGTTPARGENQLGVMAGIWHTF
jgi:predicted porin